MIAAKLPSKRLVNRDDYTFFSRVFQLNIQQWFCSTVCTLRQSLAACPPAESSKFSFARQWHQSGVNYTTNMCLFSVETSEVFRSIPPFAPAGLSASDHKQSLISSLSLSLSLSLPLSLSHRRPINRHNCRNACESLNVNHKQSDCVLHSPRNPPR